VYRSSHLARAAIFVALAAGLGFAGAVLPNVELVTVTIFLGGAATGPWAGAAIGVAAELLVSGLNPLGPALPLVFAAQLVGMAVVGLAGGLVGRRLLRVTATYRAVLLGGLGLLLALFFDVLTNLALGIHLGPVRATLAGGLVFSVVHIVSNTFVFAVLGTGGLRVLAEMGSRGGMAAVLLLGLAAGAGPRAAVAAPPPGPPPPHALADSLAPPPPDSLAPPPPDSLAAPPSAIHLGESVPDSLRVPIRGPLSGERRAVVPADRPPWMQLRAIGDTLVVGRYETDRIGAHTATDVLSRLPAVHAAEPTFASPVGALAVAGSFAWPELRADDWSLRTPRLEGRDLSRLLLDRLGPGLGFVPLAGPGELRTIDAPVRGGESPSVRLAPAEPPGDSAASRFAVETGGYGLAAAGITFADQDGRFSWGFGADNARTGRTGAIEHAATRLTMLDAAWAAGFARIALSLRNGEIPVQWKDGRETNRFDQGAALAMIAGDTLGPAWGLRVTGRDDRLSGDEFPGIEFKRKGLLVEANGWARPGRPFWWRASGEQDWFAVRYPGGIYDPHVSRAVGEAGVRLGRAGAAGPGAMGQRLLLDVAGSLRVSDRHAPSAGGHAELEIALPEDIRIGIGGGRVHLAPTYDQEVLVPRNPEATPERHDTYGLRATREGRLTLGLEALSREIAHQPFVSEDASGEPWPQFRFVERRTRHLEVRAAFSARGGPLGLEVGVWGSRLFADEDFGDAALFRNGIAPFVPEALGRAFASLRWSWFGGNFVVHPRVEFLAVGERGDFAGERLPGYGRLDVSVVGIVAEDVDLELWTRNLLDQRYDLAVIEPLSGDPYVDSGRAAAFVFRWRFLN
jgi:hypothetical protein